MIRKRTQTAAARNLVELRGRTLKNYEVAHEGKSRHAATASDRCDPMFDRELNQVGAAAKSVNLHHLVLVEFDSARGHRRVPREKRFEVLHKRRILRTSLKRAIISDTSWRSSGYGDFSVKFGHRSPGAKASRVTHPRVARPSHGILGQSTIFVPDNNGAIT